MLPLPPRRSDTPHRSDFVVSCCLRPEGEGSASGVYFLTGPPVGSLALRPGDLLTTPGIALLIGFTSFVSSTSAIQATRSLILTSVGLTPTEHASLRWTHSLPKTLRGSARLCTTGILAQARAPAVRRTQTASPEPASRDMPFELYAARE